MRKKIALEKMKVTCPFCGDEEVRLVEGTNAPAYFTCPTCSSRGFAKKKSLEILESRLGEDQEEGTGPTEEEDEEEDVKLPW